MTQNNILYTLFKQYSPETDPISLTENADHLMDYINYTQNGETIVHIILDKCIANNLLIYKFKKYIIAFINVVPDINQKYFNGETLLHLICRKYIKAQENEYNDLINILLNKGADVNIKNDGHITSLHIAFSKSLCDPCIDLLIKNADLTILDNNNLDYHAYMTPQHKIKYGNHEKEQLKNNITFLEKENDFLKKENERLKTKLQLFGHRS
jgi:hypothetical protein